MDRVLIFGISGFVGEYLAKEFQDHGYEVYGSDKVSPGKKLASVTCYQADLLDQEQVCNVIRKAAPDIIVNLAAVSSVGHSWNIPQITMDVNVNGTLNILETVRKHCKDAKILLIGSSEEYASSFEPLKEDSPLDGSSPYGISKIAQENFSRLYRERYGLRIYEVRAFNHTGVGQAENFVLPNFCKQVAQVEKSGKDGIIWVGNLSAYRDFGNVKDIVRAYRMIVEQEKPELYHVGTGVCHSIKELLEYIVSLSSQKIQVCVDQERVRPVENPYIQCDYSKIRKELGWTPQYTIEETLKELYEYYLKND